MFGGMGGGRSNLRFIRLGMLVVFLVLGATLHHRGSTYNVIHILYLIIIVGAVFALIASRRRGGGRGGFGPRGPGRGGSFGSGPPPPHVPHDNPNPDTGD